MDFVIKTNGEYDPDIENQILPIADNDTYLNLKVGKKIPSNIKIGNKSVLSVLNNINDVHFGGTFFLIALNNPFYYQLPYALGSESRVKFYIGRQGTSTAAQALLYCGSSPTTDQFSLRINKTTRTIKDCYGTSIIDTDIAVEQDVIYDVDKNKNITTIRNCKTGKIYTITHPKQTFRSDKIACIGIMYQGTKDAPVFSENADSSWLAAGCEIYDYGKLLYCSHIVDNMTRFGIAVGKTYYHQMNVHDTQYEDIDGNIRTITPCLFKLRNKTRTTDTPVLGIGKYLDAPVPAYCGFDRIGTDYKTLEYLENKIGETSGYINTGIIPNNFAPGLKYEIDGDWSDQIESGKVTTHIIGAGNYDSSLSNYKRAANLGVIYNKDWIIGASFGNTASLEKITIHNLGRCKNIMKFDENNKSYKWIHIDFVGNRQEFSGNYVGSCLSTNPYYLFSASHDAAIRTYGKIYSFKVWNTNGQIIFNGIPVEQISTGKCGIYDKVNSKFCPMIY